MSDESDATKLRAENKRLREEIAKLREREIDLIEKVPFIMGNRKSLLFYPLIVMPGQFQKYEERFGSG